MPLVEIKDFNALIDNKPFSDHPVKNKQEAFEKLVKMLRRDDYATANFWGFLYHKNYYTKTRKDKKLQTFLNKLIL